MLSGGRWWLQFSQCNQYSLTLQKLLDAARPAVWDGVCTGFMVQTSSLSRNNGWWDEISSECHCGLEQDPNKQAPPAVVQTCHQVETAGNNTFILSSLKKARRFFRAYQAADLAFKWAVKYNYAGWMAEWKAHALILQIIKTLSCQKRTDQTSVRLCWKSAAFYVS